MNRYAYDELKRLKCINEILEKEKRLFKQDYKAKLLDLAILTDYNQDLRDFLNKFENKDRCLSQKLRLANTPKVEEIVMLRHLELFEKIVNFIEDMKETHLNYEAIIKNEIKSIKYDIDCVNKRIEQNKVGISGYYKLNGTFEEGSRDE